MKGRWIVVVSLLLASSLLGFTHSESKKSGDAAPALASSERDATGAENMRAGERRVPEAANSVESVVTDPFLGKSDFQTSAAAFKDCPTPGIGCQGVYQGQCCHWPGTPSCACIDTGLKRACFKHFCIINP